MKQESVLQKYFSKAALGLLALVLVLSLSMAAASPVFAQSGNPPTGNNAGQKTPGAPRDPAAAQGLAGLAKAFQMEQQRLATQAANLKRAEDSEVKAQGLIDAGKVAGLDVSALEAGLSAFKTQIAAAGASHATAAGILAARAGFDASGKVTDPAAAKTTVESAGQALQAAHTVLLQAVKDVKQVIQTWREQNPDAAQNLKLEKGFQVSQEWLAKQAANLQKASGDGVQKVQDLIAKAKEQGQDTAALETALAAFQSQLQTAQQAHDAAAQVLTSRAGFDGAGKVTDSAQAKTTLESARQSLQQGRETLSQAVKDLGKAVKAWQAAHKPAASQNSSAN
jgi:hypothetical protein